MPRQAEYERQHHEGDPWKVLPVIEEVKAKAKEAGLWNFFMPPHSGQTHVDDTFEFEGTQLTNLEYALCAEEMGKIGWASECFNCSAPDTGNMEVLHRYGTREQKEQWLAPLMNGEIRSAFLNYRSALLREGMAGNERMPQLDLVLEGSVNGGANGEFVSAPFNDGFDNRPSYTAGVRFSVPIGPDERDARHKRRRIETVQQALQARTTVDTVLLELEVSANEMATAQNELAERAEALSMAAADQKVVEDRWQSGVSSGGGASDGVFYLDQLLTGQDRLMRAELDFAEAQATLMVARANLSRAQGTLLTDLGYEIVEDRDSNTGSTQLPRYRLGRLGAAGAGGR